MTLPGYALAMDGAGSLRRRGTNMPRVGNWNQRVVLDWIRRHGEGVTRAQLAKETGLSAQTISNLVRRLIVQGTVEERGPAPVTGPGKPTTMLGLRSDGLYAVGVHLDPLVISFVLLDLDNQVVARLRRRAPSGGRRGQVLRTIITGVERLLSQSQVTTEKLAGVGLAVPGPVDARTGTLLSPPLLPGWHRVGLRQDLQEALDLPVWLDKDVIAAAVAESWMRGAEASNFVFWYLGSGMGAGLVHRGEVLRGSSNNAGDVGQLVFDSAGADSVAGKSDCVIAGLAPYQLVAAAARQGLVAAVPDDDHRGVDRATRAICELAEAGSREAIDLLNHLARLVSRALTGVCDLLDADLVVFGGPYWTVLRPWFEEVVPRELAARQTSGRVHPLAVDGTLIGEDAGAVGAAFMVFEEVIGLGSGSLMINAGRATSDPC